MAAPPPNIEFASLTQLLFHLQAGLGSAAPTNALAELLAAFPTLAPEDQWLITTTFEDLDRINTIPSDLSARSNGPGHPGLQPLVPSGSHAVRLACPGPLEQTLSPYLLHDTLVVDLTSILRTQPSSSPPAQPLSLLRTAPLAFQPSLGQCFILCLQAKDHSLAFAEASARAVGPPELVLCGEATLLSRPIFEFSDGRCSWYLWLDHPGKPFLEDEDQRYQQHLINLLCCRAKMDFAACASRQAFKAGLSHYQAIEERATQIAALNHHSQPSLRPSPSSLGPLHEAHPTKQNKPPDQAENDTEQARRIAVLEDHLTVLPDHGLSLARCARDITTHRLTFTTNAFNAAQARRDLLRNGDTFFQSFLEQEGPTCLSQMDHDLQVLRSGERYAEQLISSLRAVVALDGQKLQRELEEKEKQRDRSLQLTIFFVGAALSISGLAAATRPRPAAKLLTLFSPSPAGVNPLPPPASAVLWLADIIIHFLIGCLGAALVLLLRHLWLVCVRRRQSSRRYRQ